MVQTVDMLIGYDAARVLFARPVHEAEQQIATVYVRHDEARTV